MKTRKIKKIPCKNRIFLAPMEEVNDPAFRLMCKKAGAGLTYTGLTSALSPKKLILKDKPVLQLFANSIKGVSDFMKKYDSKVAFWDFNLGCPAKTAKRHGPRCHDGNKKENTAEKPGCYPQRRCSAYSARYNQGDDKAVHEKGRFVRYRRK